MFSAIIDRCKQIMCILEIHSDPKQANLRKDGIGYVTFDPSFRRFHSTFENEPKKWSVKQYPCCLCANNLDCLTMLGIELYYGIKARYWKR